MLMRTWPNSRALKIEAFCDKSTAADLVKRFGGQARKITATEAVVAPSAPRGPLSIRGRLRVFSDEASWLATRDDGNALFIPAGMAFGTGDHATTATCLRLLVDLVPSLDPSWTAMDVGCGSGILAIAAEKLGAAHVEAIDFDPVCVRVAKENVRRNGCRRVSLSKGDARKISAAPKTTLILANLFSELLLESLPAFTKRLEPGGWLILSGVLQGQAEQVVAGLRRFGFSDPRVVARGKWCAGITRLSTKARRARHSSGHV
jgi:ribosomal protein L11 methyltransferase